ncbi:AGAP008920-PA, partial [Anopheles gambiae str. PEST]
TIQPPYDRWHTYTPLKHVRESLPPPPASTNPFGCSVSAIPTITRCRARLPRLTTPAMDTMLRPLPRPTTMRRLRTTPRPLPPTTEPRSMVSTAPSTTRSTTRSTTARARAPT